MREIVRLIHVAQKFTEITLRDRANRINVRRGAVWKFVLKFWTSFSKFTIFCDVADQTKILNKIKVEEWGIKIKSKPLVHIGSAEDQQSATAWNPHKFKNITILIIFPLINYFF